MDSGHRTENRRQRTEQGNTARGTGQHKDRARPDKTGLRTGQGRTEATTGDTTRQMTRDACEDYRNQVGEYRNQLGTTATEGAKVGDYRNRKVPPKKSMDVKGIHPTVSDTARVVLLFGKRLR